MVNLDFSKYGDDSWRAEAESSIIEIWFNAKTGSYYVIAYAKPAGPLPIARCPIPFSSLGRALHGASRWLSDGIQMRLL